MASNRQSKFFDVFPTIKYDINKNRIYEQTENVTNIFFRIGILKKVINNLSTYYTYTVEDNETPEIIAEKVYGDTGAGWIILYTNQIFDPQFDWPLGYTAFNSYIEAKYGSSQAAVQTVHHVEKVVTRHNLTWDTVTESRYIISPRRFTDYPAGKPFDYYVWDQALVPYPDGPDQDLTSLTDDTTLTRIDTISRKFTADRDSVRTEGGLSVTGVREYEVIDGDTIVIDTRADVITNYDYENELNDKKKQIKIIKPMYYSQIMLEFNTLTGHKEDFVRRLI
jgi:hypothetical protein